MAADGTNGAVDLRGEFIRGWDNGRGVELGRALASWETGTSTATNVVNSGYGYLRTAYAGLRFLTDTEAVLDGEEEWSWPVPNDNGVSRYNGMAGNGIGVYRKVRPRNVALLACMKL